MNCTISEILQEYDIDMHSAIKWCNSIYIVSSPNWSKDKILCFKVFTLDEEQMCRVNMIKPEYLNLEGENLILNHIQINELVHALNQPGDFWYGHYDTLWQAIIAHNNMTHYGENNWDPIPMDLPMPDYSLLKVKE